MYYYKQVSIDLIELLETYKYAYKYYYYAVPACEFQVTAIILSLRLLIRDSALRTGICRL